MIGTTIEWYDFTLYGPAAALVFAPQFFPSVSPVAGTLASLSTFAIGFLARPVGGAIMGHLGDRIGRRKMLLASLLIMGAATAGVGLLPTYAAIGVAAPILLVVLRLAQGLSVGGEWGGAVLMSMEHAPPERRTLYGSFPQLGLPAGVFLSTLVFLLVRLVLGEAAFAAWGWRIPFLLSFVLVVFGMVLRRRLEESPEFTRARENQDVVRAPLSEVFRRLPRNLVAATGISAQTSAFGIVVFTYSLTYVETRDLVSASAMMAITLTSSVVLTAGVPVGALLSQRFGRRRVIICALTAQTLWAFPYFLLLDTGSVTAALLGSVVLGLVSGLSMGPLATFIAEAFPVSVRYSGATVTYSVGGVLGGGLVSIVATALVEATDNGLGIAAYLAVLGVISVSASAALRSPVE
ncbi:MFS transporter [Streptomyces sp. NPDC056296]|uniref:MFS transporter n=1 Tax=Streptomyces sp. NPDC056296 TaxID=3345775 RepID=UPI0035DF935D